MSTLNSQGEIRVPVKLPSGTQILVAVLVCAAFATPPSKAQQQQAAMDSGTRSELSDMLRCAYEEVNKHYYDPKLQGIDWDARYKQYQGRIANAPNLGEGYRIVAAFLSGLKDSHTYFYPPDRARYDSGYRYALVGNDAFITHVRPKTDADADAKLHIGDKILGMNGFKVDRADYHDVEYYFNILSPQMSMKFDLQSPSGERRQVVVAATAMPTKRVVDLPKRQDYYDWMRWEQNWHSFPDHCSGRRRHLGTTAIFTGWWPTGNRRNRKGHRNRTQAQGAHSRPARQRRRRRRNAALDGGFVVRSRNQDRRPGGQNGKGFQTAEGFAPRATVRRQVDHTGGL
jgi:hypothetical protein